MSESFGVSLQLIKLAELVTRKTLEGTWVIAVLSQIIPARVLSINIFLPSLVKLPLSPLCVKKKRSPSLVLLNCSAI